MDLRSVLEGNSLTTLRQGHSHQLSLLLASNPHPSQQVNMASGGGLFLMEDCSSHQSQLCPLELHISTMLFFPQSPSPVWRQLPCCWYSSHNVKGHRCGRLAHIAAAAAAVAKSHQSCPTLWNPIDSSPPGFSVPGILQARTLEWVAISFSRPIPQYGNMQKCLGFSRNSWGVSTLSLFE